MSGPLARNGGMFVYVRAFKFELHFDEPTDRLARTEGRLSEWVVMLRFRLLCYSHSIFLLATASSCCFSKLS